jgi:hypothetical protein
LNNYTAQEVATLKNGRIEIQYFIAGHEIGEECGTPHLQCYFQLTKQVKITTMHKWPGWERMAHIQSAKGTDEEASAYCKKDGNYWEIGERKKMGKKGARNDLASIQEAIDKGETYDMICDTQFNTAAKFHKFIKERVQARDSQSQLNCLKKRYESSVLRPWQNALMDVVLEDPNPRHIHWIWEPTGKVGKSWIANYMGALHGATVLTSGKKVDLAYIYAQKPTKIVLFDLSRTTETSEDSRKHYLDGIYSLAEDLKNGRIVSTKYESKTVFFQEPHVIFFANFEPDYTKWSADRYVVTKL